MHFHEASADFNRLLLRFRRHHDVTTDYLLGFDDGPSMTETAPRATPPAHVWTAATKGRDYPAIFPARFNWSAEFSQFDCKFRDYPACPLHIDAQPQSCGSS